MASSNDADDEEGASQRRHLHLRRRQLWGFSDFWSAATSLVSSVVTVAEKVVSAVETVAETVVDIVEVVATGDKDFSYVLAVPYSSTQESVSYTHLTLPTIYSV